MSEEPVRTNCPGRRSRSTIRFNVDDDRQPGLLGLGQERAELPIGVQRQGPVKTRVVEIDETGRLDHVADQSRFPRLPGTDDIDNAGSPQSAYYPRGQMPGNNVHAGAASENRLLGMEKFGDLPNGKLPIGGQRATVPSEGRTAELSIWPPPASPSGTARLPELPPQWPMVRSICREDLAEPEVGRGRAPILASAAACRRTRLSVRHRPAGNQDFGGSASSAGLFLGSNSYSKAAALASSGHLRAIIPLARLPVRLGPLRRLACQDGLRAGAGPAGGGRRLSGPTSW
jgi:hypothetical protein